MYDEPKGSNVLMILLYKEYSTLLAKHNNFITGSNVFHLNNIKSSDEMKNYSGKVNLVCGQVNFWYALSRGKLLLQKYPRTLVCCDRECMVDGFTTTCTISVFHL